MLITTKYVAYFWRDKNIYITRYKSKMRFYDFYDFFMIFETLER